MKRVKIAIAGAGKHCGEIEKRLNEDVEIVFYLDNNLDKQNTAINQKKVYSPCRFPTDLADYIIISVFNYNDLKHELLNSNFPEGQIISFFDHDIDFEKYAFIFNVDKCRLYRLEFSYRSLLRQYEKSEKERKICEQYFSYEIADRILKKQIRLPHVCSLTETYEKILKDKVSISRYGDGEFEVMLHAKAFYQGEDENLARRLREILVSNEANHIVAIADDYGFLSDRTETNKLVTKRYMTEEKRRQHYQLLDMNKKYYNAYMSRPYAIYSDGKANERFNQIKAIWNDRDILIIEGDKTRMGVNNDLFANSKTIRRILAPNENAFDVYDRLLNRIFLESKEQIVLIALGPTATVLAYDLARAGYQALDVGHIDIEYEWFLNGQAYSHVENKYNNEYGEIEVGDMDDFLYSQSIVDKICI